MNKHFWLCLQKRIIGLTELEPNTIPDCQYEFHKSKSALLNHIQSIMTLFLYFLITERTSRNSDEFDMLVTIAKDRDLSDSDTMTSTSTSSSAKKKKHKNKEKSRDKVRIWDIGNRSIG